jgi:L-2-hydroxyglutarate oxidase
MKKAVIVICGVGIIGLTIARELVKRGYNDILIIDKEDGPGKHASGRNSGVLHAGIYYTPDTMRAKSCLAGNFMMREYCKEKGLPLIEAGKVIVAKNEEELPILKKLYHRAIENGAKVELVDEKELAEIEPNAKTSCQAIYSHYTAVVDPKRVILSLYKDLLSTSSVRAEFGTRFLGSQNGNVIVTNKGKIGFGIFINAAGAYSDKIAHAFEFGRGYKLIPFKGIYKRLIKKKSDLVRGNIYPLPNIRNPFLGVHFTKSVHGEVYLGPTAIPAFGRENYGILKGLERESIEIVCRDVRLFLKNENFRDVALEETRKYSFKYFFEDAKKLVRELHPSDIENSSKVGIRPQLVDLKKNELVMDFLIQKDKRSIHILNSISPAFTSSMYFAEMVVEEYFG